MRVENRCVWMWKNLTKVIRSTFSTFIKETKEEVLTLSQTVNVTVTYSVLVGIMIVVTWRVKVRLPIESLPTTEYSVPQRTYRSVRFM